MRHEGRVIPEAFMDDITAHLVAPNPYRPWFSIRRPRTRRERWLGRFRLALWAARYRIAKAIYPFSEDDE